MIGTQNSFFYRAISIVALVQSGVVVFGTLFVTAILKYKGYQGGEIPDSFFNPEALWVRHWGILYLFLPALWVAGAIVAKRVLDADKDPRAWLLLLFILAVGVAAIFRGIWYYILLLMNPYIV